MNKDLLEASKIRLFENLLLELFRKGKVSGTVHTCVGQEIIGVIVSKYLMNDDHVVSNHRGHGHYLSRTKDYEGLLAELMGKMNGCSLGVGGSQHTFNKNFLTNGIQGGMVPIAAGVALRNKKQSNGAISVAYIGDGTLGEGIIYETINIAANWGLPLLIVIENNGYAQSTSFSQTFSGDMKSRFEGFGAEFFKTSSFNLENLDETIRCATDSCRNKQKPVVIEIETYRLNSHSKGDDNRDPAEVIKYKELDLLSNWIPNSEELKEIEEFQVYLNEIMSSIDDVDTISLDYFSTPYIENKVCHYEINKNTNKRYNALINDALYNVLKDHPESIMIGEDIEDFSGNCSIEYGGAFKVSKGLSTEFPNRILNTPISESAITGIISGYSIYGQRSIVEIMFGDFTTLILDQILQHASKFNGMYGKKINCPIIVRTPMGGKRGYGPTHSQSLEKFFLGIPNFGVVALNHRLNPNHIFRSIYNFYDSPFLIVENKVMYTRDFDSQRLIGFNYEFTNKCFPEIIISPLDIKNDLTIFCYGDMLQEVEQAVFELLIEEEIGIKIICVSLISSLLGEEILRILEPNEKILVVEEGNSYNGWSTHVVSWISQRSKKITSRILGFDDIIPCNYELEAKLLPGKDLIMKSIKNFIYE